MPSGMSCASGRGLGRLTIMSRVWLGPPRHQKSFATEAHGKQRIKDENKILMATESTEEHGKIKSTN